MTKIIEITAKGNMEEDINAIINALENADDDYDYEITINDFGVSKLSVGILDEVGGVYNIFAIGTDYSHVFDRWYSKPYFGESYDKIRNALKLIYEIDTERPANEYWTTCNYRNVDDAVSEIIDEWVSFMNRNETVFVENFGEKGNMVLEMVIDREYDFSFYLHLENGYETDGCDWCDPTEIGYIREQLTEAWFDDEEEEATQYETV